MIGDFFVFFIEYIALVVWPSRSLKFNIYWQSIWHSGLFVFRAWSFLLTGFIAFMTSSSCLFRHTCINTVCVDILASREGFLIASYKINNNDESNIKAEAWRTAPASEKYRYRQISKTRYRDHMRNEKRGSVHPQSKLTSRCYVDKHEQKWRGVQYAWIK